VPVTGDAALDEVVPALRRAGVEVTELALQLPSLDEVFHALTDGSPTTAGAREEELV